jgi:hypothetical protein
MVRYPESQRTRLGNVEQRNRSPWMLGPLFAESSSMSPRPGKSSGVKKGSAKPLADEALDYVGRLYRMEKARDDCLYFLCIKYRTF